MSWTQYGKTALSSKSATKTRCVLLVLNMVTSTSAILYIFQTPFVIRSSYVAGKRRLSSTSSDCTIVFTQIIPISISIFWWQLRCHLTLTSHMACSYFLESLKSFMASISNAVTNASVRVLGMISHTVCFVYFVESYSNVFSMVASHRS